MSISGIDGPESSQLSADYAPDESRISEQRQQSDFLDSLMISKDRDSNGILTLDESGLRKEEFSKLDADGNGSVTPSEVQAVLEKLQKEKGELGKLDVQMQQAEESAVKSPRAASQKMVSLEDSGLDEKTFNMLDSDGDGKVSQAEIDSVKSEEKQAQEGNLLSEALAEFEKNFFRKKKDDEEEKERELNKEEVVDEEDKQSVQITGINAEQKEESTNDRQGRSFSARQMVGVRAYQDQAANFFASAAQSSVKFEY